MVPQTALGRIYAIVVMFVGVAMYGFLIAVIARILSRVDAKREEFRERVRHISLYMQRQQVPEDLKRQVLTYLSNDKIRL